MSTNVDMSGTVAAEDVENRIAVVVGDGGDDSGASVDEEKELAKFKDEIAQISKDAAYSVNQRRFAAEEARFCIWEGQTPDGKKHADAMNGAKPFPFEGASDARIRLADMLVNEEVALLCVAALRSLPKVKGLELLKEGTAGRMETILKWVIDNQLAGEYFREITKLAQFQAADSPAGAVLGVFWQQEYGLKMTQIALPDLEKLLVTQYGLNQSELGALEAMLNDPGRDKESAEFLEQLVPQVTTKRARRMVKELRETQKTEFPEKYLRVNRPKVCAYRLFDDIFFPANTTDPQTCRQWFVREWLSEADVRARQVTMEYDEKFVEDVLKHNGATGFPLYKRDPIQGDFSISRQESKETFKDLYEVITVYYIAVNDDNIPAIYTQTFHHAVDCFAKERALLGYDHGKYPLVYFSREVLTQRLWDARGIPELVATDQWALKLLDDSFADNVALGTVPPIKVPRKRSKLAIDIGPMVIIKEERPGEISWMAPPAFPAGNEKQQAAIMARVDQYFGRLTPTVAPQLQQLHQTVKTMWFLENLRQGLTMVLQLVQQYMPDEQLAAITGADGFQVARTTEDIQGQFNLQLSFNPSALNMDYLKVIFEIVGKYILPIDTVSTIQRDKLVQWMFSCVDANVAQEVLMPVQSAQQHEADDEDDNLAKIMAGVEPAMPPEGLNFGLRLNRLQQNVQKNPEILKKLTPMSQKIFVARVKYLQNQVQQQKNAQIGRQVGQPALDPSPEGMPSWAQGAEEGGENRQD